MKEAMSALRPATRRWLSGLRKEYFLQDYHVRLLVAAGRLWDRAAECAVILEQEGPVIRDRFSQQKAHPGVEIERQSLIGFSKLLREVGLDIDRPEDPRPPTRPGGYGGSGSCH
jgi:hypothetical protein